MSVCAGEGEGVCVCGFQALSCASIVVSTHPFQKRNQNLHSTPNDIELRAYATEKDISAVRSVRVGWCLTILPPRAWKKKIHLVPPKTKITILITMVVLCCSHSAAGRTWLRWHRPLGMGTRSGLASREITGWCGEGEA